MTQDPISRAAALPCFKNPERIEPLSGGITNVNLRVAVDAFANVYIIGRARSTDERDKTIAAARETKGAKKIVDYIDVRP